MARLDAYHEEVAPHFGQGLSALRPACPLLVDGQCSIYEARPILCRAMNSLDVGVCERWKDHPEENVGVPSLAGQRKLGHYAMEGVKEALGQIKRPYHQVDFARALGTALREQGFLEEALQKNLFYFASPAAAIRQAPPNRQPDYPKYGPGEEALGLLHPIDLVYAQYLEEIMEDTQGAIDAAQGEHPIYRLWKIRVPGVYQNAGEMPVWRDYFVKALADFENSSFDPREAYDALVIFQTLHLTYQNQNDREIMARIGRLVCDRIASQALPDLCRPIERRPRQGKLKVGYISENLSGGSGSEWALGWLKHRSEDVETYAFNLSLFNEQPGPYEKLADHYYRMPGPVRDEAKLIKSLGLDVLIHTDVGMTGRNLQFASLRLAPVQCTGWGSPGTTGLPTIDYFLSSELMEPENGDSHYTEKLVRLPGSGICYLPETTAVAPWRLYEYGLRDEPLYLCCQTSFKLIPQWDSLYVRINDATRSPIVFVDSPTRGDRFRKRITAAGVKGIFMPKQGYSYYFGLLKQAAVSLDPPGWNGGVTTIQALALGTPVVTLPGEFRRGRQTQAFLRAANAPGLIAKDLDDYVDLVSNEERKREAMKDFNPQGVIEDVRTVRALEDFLLSLFD